jgi:hypothetical protein
VLLCRGAAPPLPVIGSTPDDTLLAVLDPLLAPSDTGAVADGATKPWSQVPRKRLLRVAGESSQSGRPQTASLRSGESRARFWARPPALATAAVLALVPQSVPMAGALPTRYHA